MTLSRYLLLPLGLLTGFSLSAETPLTDLIPENAAFVLSVRDTPEVLSQWEKSPWAKTWNDEQVKKFFGPLRAQWKIEDWDKMAKEKTGYTVEELLALATGDVILALNDFSFVEQGEGAIPPILIAVDIGDNQSKVEALFAKGQADSEQDEETTEFSGVTVHILTPKEDSDAKDRTPTVWAVTDGKWLVSPSKDVVLAAIDAIKNSGLSNPWGRSERFARLKKRVGDAHLSFVVNAEAIYPVFQKAVEAKASAGESAQGGGFDSAALLSALGLDAWKELYGAFALEAEGTRGNFGLTYSESRGLLKLLAYQEGPVEKPDFVSPNWATVSSTRFSIKDAFSAIEEILEAFNPAISGMVQGQIRGINKQLGIDIKRDLLGSTGNSIITATSVPAKTSAATPESGMAQMDQLFVISLENAEAFTTALEALKRMVGGPQPETTFKTRDYLGEKIVTFEPPAAANAGPRQKGVSYSIAKGRFFLSVGSSAPLESALQGLAGGRESLWEKSDVRAALAQLPANASAFQYQDIKSMIAMGFDSLAAAAAMMKGPANEPVPVPLDGEEEGVEPAEAEEPANQMPIDPAFRPDAEAIAKYWSYGWGYAVRESSGIHATTQIVYPK